MGYPPLYGSSATMHCWVMIKIILKQLIQGHASPFVNVPHNSSSYLKRNTKLSPKRAALNVMIIILQCRPGAGSGQCPRLG